MSLADAVRAATGRAVRQVERRVALYQLFPLLVHAALFGGGYPSSAERVARAYA